MKPLKVGILLLLIMKSAVLSGASLGMNSCQADSDKAVTEVTKQCDSDADGGCCEIPSCECVCCGHIFIDQYAEFDLQEYTPLVEKHEFQYSTQYSFINHIPIWHPPKMI